MRPVSLALSILQNRLGGVPRPSWCTYLVTYRCNARCQMCDSWRIKPGDELTVHDVGVVFGKIGDLDIVRLSGGEPFLRKDLLEIAETIHGISRPSVIHITTNASYPDEVEEFVERFSAPEKLQFMVSVDGLEEEHDRNRGEDVTFASCIETLKRLCRLREKYGITVTVQHTVISPQSMADATGIQEILDGMGVDVFTMLAYSDSAMYGAKRQGKRAEDLISLNEYPIHPLLKDEDYVSFVRDQLGRVGLHTDAKTRYARSYYLRGLYDRVTKCERPAPKPPCVSLRSHIRLLPDGSVPVCQFNTERVGNLLRGSFDDVWFNERAKDNRAWVDDCPGCWAGCEVTPNALFTGDFLLDAAKRMVGVR